MSETVYHDFVKVTQHVPSVLPSSTRPMYLAQRNTSRVSVAIDFASMRLFSNMSISPDVLKPIHSLADVCQELGVHRCVSAAKIVHGRKRVCFRSRRSRCLSNLKRTIESPSRPDCPANPSFIPRSHIFSSFFVSRIFSFFLSFHIHFCSLHLSHWR